jgi:cell division protein FtsX
MDPMVHLLLRRGIRRGISSVRRDRAHGSTIVLLTGIFILMQMLLLLGIGLSVVADTLRTNMDIRLELRQGATDRSAQEFMAALKARPDVQRAAFITREQAYELERRRHPDLIAFLDRFNIQNPFHDTIAVTLGTLDAYDAFVAFIKQPAWQTVVDAQFLTQAGEQEEEVRAMLQITNASAMVNQLFIALAFLVLLSALVEFARRRVMHRSDEIFVERMSGAPELSVIVPFATEAAILLGISVVLSGIIVILFLFAIPLLLSLFSASPVYAETMQIMAHATLTRGPIFLVIELLAVPLMAFTGVFLATQRNPIRSLFFRSS